MRFGLRIFNWFVLAIETGPGSRRSEVRKDPLLLREGEIRPVSQGPPEFRRVIDPGIHFERMEIREDGVYMVKSKL